jgi:hypothetical protein
VDVQASRLKAAAPFQLAVINLRPPRRSPWWFFIAVEKQMQRSKDKSRPLKLVPSRIAAVFESREWLDFVKRAEDRPKNHRSSEPEKIHKSSLVLKKDSSTIPRA